MSIALLLISSLAAPVPPHVALRAPLVLFEDEAITSAGGDVEALLALAEARLAEKDEDGARRAWSRILELHADHEAAHRGLRHHRYGDRWYVTYAELSKARRDEARRRLDEEGLVPLGDEWVPQADLPFRRMGWEQDGAGQWAPPGVAAARAERAKLLADGYQLQHRTPIPPAEFDAWRAGKWKVGDEWLDVEAANEAHSKLGAWWEVPGEHFVALTTVPEEHTRWVVWWADQVHGELAALFGLSPAAAPEFVVLNSIAQYNDFAAGSAVQNRAPADALGYSSIHYAFFTDGWSELVGGAPFFRATGAAYYDPADPNLAPYGQHAVRHAAALAWLEAVDPSWNAVSLMVTSPAGGFPDGAYWGEKRIPRWLRYGAAAYCERFFEDKNVAEGGDPLWARKWALENLAKGGRMDPVEEILALEFDTADAAGSVRRIHEAGLLVHYTLDGGDKKVTRAFETFREALARGEDVIEPLAAYEKALAKAEKKIARFGGL